VPNVFFQAIEAIKYAKSVGVTAQGKWPNCFDLIFHYRLLEIITPIRDLKLSRQEEVDYLSKNGVHYSWEKAQYSINKGLWGQASEEKKP
jgi:argininosuccinate synthase